MYGHYTSRTRGEVFVGMKTLTRCLSIQPLFEKKAMACVCLNVCPYVTLQNAAVGIGKEKSCPDPGAVCLCGVLSPV